MPKQIKLPLNYQTALESTDKKEELYDYQDIKYRDEHYGLYLMSDSERIYLDIAAFKEYKYETLLPNQIACHKRLTRVGPAQHNIFSLFPERKEEIWSILELIYTSQVSTVLVQDMLRGIGDIITSINFINPKLTLTPDFVTHDNINQIRNYVQDKECPISRGRFMSRVLYMIMPHSRLSFELPPFDKLIHERRRKVEHKLEEDNLKNSATREGLYDLEGSISMPVIWQLDIYCRKELDSWMKRIEEFNGWKKDYEVVKEDGGLLSLKNIAFTYFYVADSSGRGATNYISFYNELAVKLHKISLYWKDHKDFSHIKGNYKSQAILAYEQKLRTFGEGGILITIDSLKMLTFWMFEVFPRYPFEKTPDIKFQSISSFSLSTPTGVSQVPPYMVWKSNRLTNLRVDPFEFLSLFTSTSYHLYSFYLLILIRSKLNQEVVQDWKVQRQETGEYTLGKIAGPVHMVEGYKGRSNTIQDHTFDMETSKYVQFFLKHMRPLYEFTGKRGFFQYTGLSGEYYTWSSSTISNLKKRASGIPIFGKYQILTNSGERVDWMDHRNIRPMKNYAGYRKDVARIQRQIELGHLNPETLNTYQQSLTFKGSDSIKTAITQNTLMAIFRGEITSKDDEKAAVFEEQPMNRCANPEKPSYYNAKQLKENEKCVNWRMCMMCSECRVIPKLHGPVIQAWLNVMIEEEESFYTTEEWEKEYDLDIFVVNDVLDRFDKDERHHCIKEAPKFQDFVRTYVMNSSVKIKTKAYDGGN